MKSELGSQDVKESHFYCENKTSLFQNVPDLQPGGVEMDSVSLQSFSSGSSIVPGEWCKVIFVQLKKAELKFRNWKDSESVRKMEPIIYIIYI